MNNPENLSSTTIMHHYEIHCNNTRVREYLHESPLRKASDIIANKAQPVLLCSYSQLAATDRGVRLNGGIRIALLRIMAGTHTPALSDNRQTA